MCGILGAYSSSGVHTPTDALIRMREAMIHRGPDGFGLWRSKREDCVLGHRRLSIIDRSHDADQPMVNDDDTVAIVLNGEIYNYRELKTQLPASVKWKTDHSDTEVLLHAYEVWGLSVFDRLAGMFAVAIYDAREADRPVLHLIRDRFGVKPFYLTQTPRGEWLFASEIRALLAHPDVRVAMNGTAFWHYLTFVVSPAPMTMYQGIWKIPAGVRIRIDHHNQGVAKTWWDSQVLVGGQWDETDLSFEVACGEILRLLRQSVSRRMVSDVPVGVLLSGGVDSSLIVGLMNELTEQPIKTYTIGYKDDDSGNEFEQARRVSKRYRTLHHEKMIDVAEVMNFIPDIIQMQGEPVADNVCIPLYFISKLAKETGTTVLQVGEGADENGLGYWWCDHYLKLYNRFSPMKRGLSLRRWFYRWKGRHLTAGDGGEDHEVFLRVMAGQELFWGGAVCWWGGIRKQLTPSIEPFLTDQVCPVQGLLPLAHTVLDSHAVVADYIKRVQGVWREPVILQKIPYLEQKLRLPEHLLMRLDKMSMASSVEAREPYLDHELVEFLMRLPVSYKLHDGLGKRILKKVAEPYVDNDLLYRRKQGFGAPMEQWFREPTFARRLELLLDESGLVKQGYIDKVVVRDLLRHQVSVGGGYSFHLWTVFNAMIWYELQIEGKSFGFS